MRLLIALMMLFHCLLANSAEPATRFNRLTIEDGLSNNSVLSIIEGQKGFLWFGTQDGLNRFDGYEFKVFRHDPANPNSISDNYIRSLYQDKQGFIWIGTVNGGLNRFDPQTERFTHFRHQTSNPSSLSSDSVASIYEDSKQTLWVATRGDGLNKFDKQTNQFSHFKHDPSNPHSLSHNNIWTIHEDNFGTLWVGTWGGGLNHYNAQTNQFTSFKHNQQNPNSISHNIIRVIHEDNQGRLWIGTDGGGLDRFDRKNKRFIHHRHDPNNLNSLSNNRIRTIDEDASGKLWIGTLSGLNQFNPKTGQFRHFEYQASDPLSLSDNLVQSVLVSTNGTIWVGTWTGGINQYDIRKDRFGHFKHRPSDPNSLGHNNVNSIYQDYNHMLWIGTGGGINRFDSLTKQFTYLQHQTSKPNSLSDNNVFNILDDKEGGVWVATYGGGLNKYYPQNNQFKHFKHDSSDPYSLSTDLLLTIYKDSADRLWLGSFGGGLSRFDRQNQQFIHFKHNSSDPHSLSHNDVTFIHEDKKSHLWIGTRGGLNLYESQSGHFRHFKNSPSDPHSLSHNDVTAIYQDNRNTLWIGTRGGGLSKFDEQSSHFKHYREKDGLANDNVMGILEDKTGVLWLSTYKGLSRFDPKIELFRNFTVDDGLQNSKFNRRAAFKSANGELFFGGTNGFNRFYPENIIDDVQPPTVVLTDFQLDNQSVPVSTKTKAQETSFNLSKTIDDSNSITLTHQQNLMSFTFAALNFISPMKSQYAYQLQGWDKDWLSTNAKNRRATYSNIPSGEYTLRVKASNGDGYWNEQGKSLKITILPPPWKTWWAYSIYTTILAALLILLIYILTERKKARNQRAIENLKKVQEQAQNEHALNQRLTQLDRLKDEFLANTSHELRTPLNGIIGLAESLIDGIAGQLPDKANHNLAMVVASGKRLTNLVNDLLDFSKLKNHNLTLHIQPVDLYSMAEVVLALSQPLLGNQKIKLVNQVPRDIQPALADENRLLQVLHNLVGNAIKFTDDGQVTVSTTIDDKSLTLRISDTGIGIAPDQLDMIFDSFEQLEGHNRQHHSGTGLGLAISQQLIKLHGGRIEVDSEQGKGTTFKFKLPLTDKTLPSDEQTAHIHTTNQSISRLHQFEQPSQSPILSAVTPNEQNQQRHVLLVDDEPVNRQVLHDHLSLQNYQLTEASGGQEALQAIENDGPFDLILLDIMMPGTSGYEVCQTLRETYPLNDLPVIFLTAKNQVADMVQSFSVGANDYLTKPVSKYELLTRVETHLTFLDIHRNLENKVVERTVLLAQKNNEIMNTQQQLVQAAKMASLGTLTAGVAHEINNPTNFVHVSAQNLERDITHLQQFIFDLAGDAEEEVLTSFRAHFKPLYDHLNLIQDGTERIKMIVQDLRTFTQLDAAEQKTVNITTKLQSTINLVQTQYLKTIEFITDFGQTPELYCYPAQLNQVFMNLIVNACDAIKAKQNKTDLTNQYMGTITITCRAINDAIEIAISDNGCGMTDESKNKVFEPFYTTKDVGAGTGLGLSISFGIIQKHDGELLVESQLGIGTTFTVRLPAKAR